MQWEYIDNHYKPLPIKMLAYDARRIVPPPDSGSSSDPIIKKFLVVGTMRND